MTTLYLQILGWVRLRPFMAACQRRSSPMSAARRIDSSRRLRSMREITSHKVNGLNEALQIQVLDEPGAGGANHKYAVYGFFTRGNPSAGSDNDETRCLVQFQHGPIKEAGVNGISNEALLAIVIDRLECFQRGQYSCRENALALTKLQEAMHWMLHRTRERIARGVEGTSAK